MVFTLPVYLLVPDVMGATAITAKLAFYHILYRFILLIRDLQVYHLKQAKYCILNQGYQLHRAF